MGPGKAGAERGTLSPVRGVADHLHRHARNPFRGSVPGSVIHHQERISGTERFFHNPRKGRPGIIGRDYDTGMHDSATCSSVPKELLSRR